MLLSTNFRVKLTKFWLSIWNELWVLLAIFNARANHLGILTDWNENPSLFSMDLKEELKRHVTHQKPLIYIIGNYLFLLSVAVIPDFLPFFVGLSWSWVRQWFFMQFSNEFIQYNELWSQRRDTNISAGPRSHWQLERKVKIDDYLMRMFTYGISSGNLLVQSLNSLRWCDTIGRWCPSAHFSAVG